MTEPILRATTDRDEYLDPSEDALLLLFTDVQQGDAQFFIVEKLSDPSGSTYFQSTLDPDGAFLIEHRAGSPDEHWGATTTDVHLAHQVATGWAFDRPGWQDLVPWTRVELG